MPRLRPVGWPRQGPGDAVQVMIPTVGEPWFDPEELRRLVREPAELIQRAGPREFTVEEVAQVDESSS